MSLLGACNARHPLHALGCIGSGAGAYDVIVNGVFPQAAPCPLSGTVPVHLRTSRDYVTRTCALWRRLIDEVLSLQARV